MAPARWRRFERRIRWLNFRRFVLTAEYANVVAACGLLRFKAARGQEDQKRHGDYIPHPATTDRLFTGLWEMNLPATWADSTGSSEFPTRRVALSGCSLVAGLGTFFPWLGLILNRSI